MNPDADQHYLHVSPIDSQKLYPKNKARDFVVALPLNLKLIGDWEMRLLSVTLKQKIDRQRIIVCCDLCRESYCYGEMLPMVKELNFRDFKAGGRCVYSQSEYYDLHPISTNLVRFTLKGLTQNLPDNIVLSVHLRKK